MGQSTKRALMKDAPTVLRREEFALNVEQSELIKLVAKKDAQTLYRREESALDTVQRSKMQP